MDKDMIRFVRNDEFARFIGLQLVTVEPGYAVVRMEVKPHHLNGVGSVQGGAIFTLADYAFAAACNSGGNATLGINANISYFRIPKGRVLTAEAREVSTTNRLCTYSVDVFDEDNVLIARLTATGYIKRDKS
ncbi:MAG TPA: PaaI family thioesterase [Thermoclostridium sp.]|nr:PaaI family thioesterase [Clostridiaceae bacterium]HOQ75444.1 PaaI family thioesterase [Thermoclostridium sp.]HPU45343.1 PaaI family thioesterase [Thermoclostridium sp.]